eukprot:TRINITY_DN3992_c0_g1_i1.p1 TRINITY_DN3992_c0_g1~~TRINITY_DN3992_c0_g1_i1.p1  ORF type:complete len:244 (+),score=71.31 TRINITY_DN3992_c0_g1_i1:29-733(+)
MAVADTTLQLRELHGSAFRLIVEIRAQIERAGDAAASAGAGDAAFGAATKNEAGVDTLDEALANVNKLARIAMELQANLHTGIPKYDYWRVRVSNIQEELKSLKSTLDKTLQRKTQTRERELLLQSSNHAGDQKHHTRMGYLFQEAQSLQNSNQTANDLESLGAEIDGALGRQNSQLLSVKSRLPGMHNMLMFSKGVMRTFERRVHVDRYLVFGGMVVTLLVIFVVYFLVSRYR